MVNPQFYLFIYLFSGGQHLVKLIPLIMMASTLFTTLPLSLADVNFMFNRDQQLVLFSTWFIIFTVRVTVTSDYSVKP